jgi:hypothetical protein
MKKCGFVVAVILCCFLGSAVENLMIKPQIAMGATAPPKIIRASSFELVDNSGTKRASLEIENEDKTAALYLWDSNGKPLVVLKASPDGSSLLMKIENKPVLGFAVEKNTGVMGFANDVKTGKPGMRLSVTEEGAIIIIYEDGKPRAVKTTK